MNIHPLPFARSKGFALVVTLSLLILLTVIAVGLLSLSSVSLRASSAEGAQQVARQNARLALTIAIGQLQTHLGPDTRISARAETMAQHPAINGSVPTGSATSWWLGVSHSDPDENLTGSDPQPVVWMVSGLTPGAGPAAQLSGEISDPVDLVGEGSLDLALTGGEAIQAGKVLVTNANGDVSGAYAYFVDDEGMKAQLVGSRQEVRNDSTAENGQPYGGGVLPGTYPVGILNGMSDLGTANSDELHRLISTKDLELAGLSKPVAKSKFFSFTTSSRGVLADVKNGGLKKDLTVPFDAPLNQSAVRFNRAFPKNNLDKHLVMDPEKRKQAKELNRTDGYIHWGIFRDYYQLKSHLRNVGGVVSLTATTFEKAGLLQGSGSGVYTGGFGPHATWSGLRGEHSGMPYGDYTIYRDAVGYRHNPITPVLSSMQQNGWVSQLPGAPSRLRTHVQMFTSHYNPYNVGVIMNGDNIGHTGPRIHNYPQVNFTVSGTTITDRPGLDGKLQAHARGGLVIKPGRSQVLGFSSDRVKGQEIDEKLYSPAVRQLSFESVFQDINSPAPPNPTVTVDFIPMTNTVMQGVDEQNGNNEVAQVFYNPFSWDIISGRPGKRVVLKGPLNQPNATNNVARNAFFLRTTREAASPIRPLVDANIRAIWNNPRWDSPLELPLLASHSEASAITPSDNLPQMNTTEPPYGFSYLGSDRDPAGFDRVILFDVPREDLVSLGQLQHASAGRFSYEPTYIAGNSYANLRIPLGDWRATVTDTFSSAQKVSPSAGSFSLYDASYLVNDRIWDEYIFTTIPQENNNYGTSSELPLTAARYKAFLEGEAFLANPRFIPYEPRGSTFTLQTLRDLGDPAGNTGAFRHNAGHLIVDGAFNVNSTSVDAWEAFLSGTHQLPVQKLDQNGRLSGFSPAGNVQGVRFPRVKSVFGDGMATTSIDENYWTGFRDLTSEEVRELATRIVEEIKQRGPFLTLGEFVNRKLEDSELGKSGALQAALDATVNRGLDENYEAPADPSEPNLSNIAADSTQGAGFPGQLLQGDILQALSPYMQVRSDSFTVRAYGESRNPSTGKINAKAWCEATVQRMPDAFPHPTGGNSDLQDLILPSSPFGREFRMVSFRWLHPDEI